MQDNATRISYHIKEWRRCKRLIKSNIPRELLLECFVKYLFPYISKDVSTSSMTSKEEAILRAQHMDLIYSQSRILYEIIPEAPWSTHSVNKPKPRPHADGVVGLVNSPTIESLDKKIHELLVN